MTKNILAQMKKLSSAHKQRILKYKVLLLFRFQKHASEIPLKKNSNPQQGTHNMSNMGSCKTGTT